MGALPECSPAFLEALEQKICKICNGREKKWSTEVSNLKIGDVIFVPDYNIAPLQWLLRPIVRVYSGPDNFVRVVKIQTQSEVCNRAVPKPEKLRSPSD